MMVMMMLVCVVGVGVVVAVVAYVAVLVNDIGEKGDLLRLYLNSLFQCSRLILLFLSFFFDLSV
jgi:hypothetical protein